MAQALADTGATLFLNTLLRATAVQDTKLHLYVTNIAINDSRVVGDFTEAAGGGYAAVTLSRGTNWVISGSAPVQAVYAAQTFSFNAALTGPNSTIYGYYITDNAGTTLISAETLNASGNTTMTPGNGDTLTITPKITMGFGTPT